MRYFWSTVAVLAFTWMAGGAKAQETLPVPTEATVQRMLLPDPTAALPATQDLRQYLIEVSLYECDEAGKERRLAAPNLVTLEGRPVTFMAGSELPVQSAGSDAIHYIPIGVKLTATVKAAENDQLNVQVHFDYSRALKSDRNDKGFLTCLDIKNIQMEREVCSGETIDLALKDQDSKKVTFRVEITVKEIGSTTKKPQSSRLFYF
jgi:hypothetical protein